MSARVSAVTKEMILSVYEYKQKFGDKISHAEIATLVGIGESTVGKIFQGRYDHLLKEDKPEQETKDSVPVNRQLANISEQVCKLANNIQGDNMDMYSKLEDIHKELTSIGDLLHIIAVYHMRTQKDPTLKSKMAAQIQFVHSNKRISDALK